MKQFITILGILISTLFCRQKPIAVYSFEKGEARDYRIINNAKMSEKSGTVISGKVSLVWDSGNAKGVWNEFFRSDFNKLKLDPRGTYTISFKYKILEKKHAKGGLYILARSIKGGVNKADKGMSYITTGSGTGGTKTITVTLDNFSDYSIIIGYHFQGKVSVDEITVYEGAVKID